MSDLTQEPSDQEKPSRRSSARERRQKRRERERARASTTTTTNRVSRHISTASNLNIPQIDPRILRGIAFVVAAGIFMLVIILAIGMFKNDPVLPDPNALWLDQTWMYTPHDDAEIHALVSRLNDYQMGVVYAHISELNFDNTWTGDPDGRNQFTEVEPLIMSFTQQMEQFASDITLYGVVHVQADIDADGYRLDDDELVNQVSTFSTEVINRMGFDGVLLNIQPVWNNDENFLRLVREVRRAVGDDVLIAVAVPPDWTPVGVDVPMPVTIAPGTAWDTEYKQRVALLQVDQVVLKAYDSYMTVDTGFTSADYAGWLAYQVKAYADALAYLDGDAELIVAVSTMDDTPVVRDVRVESLSAALSGIDLGLQQALENAEVFAGVVVVSSSETDDVEWQQLQEGWRRPQ